MEWGDNKKNESRLRFGKTLQNQNEDTIHPVGRLLVKHPKRIVKSAKRKNNASCIVLTIAIRKITPTNRLICKNMKTILLHIAFIKPFVPAALGGIMTCFFCLSSCCQFCLISEGLAGMGSPADRFGIIKKS
jgi:hypothetical protein